jgi:hypothetical protein
MFLHPTIGVDDTEIEELDLARMGEDPLTYFLTPTVSSYGEDGEGMDFDIEFDAGIEDVKHPPPIVRSVSPSSLEGLSRPPPRPPTPPRSPATPDLDYSMSATPDEQDDYLEAAAAIKPSGPLALSRRLKGLAHGKLKASSKQGASAMDAPLPLAFQPSSHASNRGRAMTRPALKPAAASGKASVQIRRSTTTPSRLSPHAWREPSPDVWSIEEETQEELNVEIIEDGEDDIVARAGAVDIPAAKPKKRVRFALPAEGSGKAMH